MMSVVSEYTHSMEGSMSSDDRETMTLREARKAYFDANGFGDNGGYDDAWVDFKLGPIPMPFPNTAGRVRAVRHHDVHHILTGYATNITGELEISAWEIGAGCRDFHAAWILNLGGMAGGFLSSPRRVFRAFVHGRRQRTTYGEDLDALLDMSVGTARRRFGIPCSNADAPAPTATAGDVALYALSTSVGILVAALLLAVVVPLAPFGLLASAMRARAEVQARASGRPLSSTSVTGRGSSS